MLLAIDCGNTNIVFAVYDGAMRRGMWRCKTDASRTSDEYLAFLSQHFELKNLHVADVNDVIVSSVVPDVDFALEQLAQKGFGVRPQFVKGDITAESIGIKVEIDRPSELGADRLVNAVAVREEYKKLAIVIDFGTATTLDVIGADGTFFGGVIAPGINLSMAALHAAAAKLPKISVEKPARAIGKNTVEAMQSGVFFGYVGLIEGLLGRMVTELGETPLVIATGGLAPLFKDSIPMISVVDEELTLKGLLSIYGRLKNR
ncbi:MAG TPA: type III pantothenate kinase [Alphaproteobacteria bacterium]|nr:type III pantothenate kinase [Alphaproteobacteria bacterium]HNS44487.1 type III pantothenate kinase [Alphaproteobacteria bacterium]